MGRENDRTAAYYTIGLARTKGIPAMTCQSHAMSGPPDITQCAALAALNGPTDALVQMNARFLARRSVICEALNAIPDVHWCDPGDESALFAEVERFLDAGDAVVAANGGDGEGAPKTQNPNPTTP